MNQNDKVDLVKNPPLPPLPSLLPAEKRLSSPDDWIAGAPASRRNCGLNLGGKIQLGAQPPPTPPAALPPVPPGGMNNLTQL